jgi:hypothetical protein
MTRRTLLASVWMAALVVASAAAQAPALPKMTVYKSPTCGCCAKWVEHMKKAGFAVTVNDVDNVSLIKAEHHVPTALAACHTALVDGYVVEGHVPDDAILKMLKEKPKVLGIAVAGMPMGAPGMEAEGVPQAQYDVMAFDSTGASHVYVRK